MPGMDELTTAVDQAEEHAQRKKQRRKQEEQRREQQRQRFWMAELMWLPEKLCLASDVFAWCQRFADTMIYRRLVDLRWASLVGSRPGTLWLYTGGWGHKLSRDPAASWSRLHLQPDGTLLYLTGYKWMAFMDELEFRTPEMMALRLSKNYIDKLHRYLHNGDVYMQLKQNLERNH